MRAVEARTGRLTEEFLHIWRRPDNGEMEDNGDLTLILSVPRRPGWYAGWKTEFDYVRYLGEPWEVRDIKTLYKRVFQRLWTTHRPIVLAYSGSKKGPLLEAMKWESQWEPLPDSHYLFTGYFPQYMLRHVQDVLDEVGLADQVFVGSLMNSTILDSTSAVLKFVEAQDGETRGVAAVLLCHPRRPTLM